MIWHIFKKDWKLTWPLVAIVIAIYGLNTWIWLILGHFGEPSHLRRMASLLPILVYLGMVVAIVAAIHQDAIPGDRQDWLTRPIRRHHLLLAKLLFIALAVLTPMFVIDVATTLMTGFAATDAIRDSAGRIAKLLCFVCLPAAGFAAVTRSLIELIAGGFVAFIIPTAIGILSGAGGLTARPGVPFFVVSFAWAIIFLLASAAIFGIQYGWRRTIPARVIMMAAVLLFAMAFYIPFKPVFASLAWLWPNASVTVALIPERQRNTNPSEQKLSPRSNTEFEPRSNSEFEGQIESRLGLRAISLPLRIAGLPSNSFLALDRAEVSVLGTDGKILYQNPWMIGAGAVTPNNGPMPSARLSTKIRQGPDPLEDLYARQVILFPPKVYARLKDQRVQIEIDYSLVRLTQQSTVTFSAIGGDARPANGSWWCKTKVDDDGDEILAGCITPDEVAACISGVLENPKNGQRNPEAFGCSDYSPIPGHAYPMALTQFGIELKFRDLDGLAKYPVDDSQIDQARVLLTGYAPVAYMTRHVVSPEIRLSDWIVTPEAKTSMSGSSVRE